MEGKKKERNKNNNGKFSGHYVRQRTHHFHVHALRSEQYSSLQILYRVTTRIGKKQQTMSKLLVLTETPHKGWSRETLSRSSGSSFLIYELSVVSTNTAFYQQMSDLKILVDTMVQIMASFTDRGQQGKVLMLHQDENIDSK